MKKKFTNKLSNAVAPAAPASVWGKGVPGKGGMTSNPSTAGKKTK